MKLAFHFLEATPNDLELIITLMREYYEYDRLQFDEAAARGALQQLLQEPAFGRVWLLEVDHAIAGYFALCLGFSLEYHGRDAFVDEIYIREAYRGQGLGNRALQFLETECRALGVQALHLEVERANTNAQEVYRKNGFVDHDRYLMTKSLSTS